MVQSKLTDSEIITISLVGKVATINLENTVFIGINFMNRLFEFLYIQIQTFH